jgi:hypothetical protein
MKRSSIGSRARPCSPAPGRQSEAKTALEKGIDREGHRCRAATKSQVLEIARRDEPRPLWAEQGRRSEARDLLAPIAG